MATDCEKFHVYHCPVCQETDKFERVVFAHFVWKHPIEYTALKRTGFSKSDMIARSVVAKEVLLDLKWSRSNWPVIKSGNVRSISTQTSLINFNEEKIEYPALKRKKMEENFSFSCDTPVAFFNARESTFDLVQNSELTGDIESKTSNCEISTSLASINTESVAIDECDAHKDIGVDNRLCSISLQICAKTPELSPSEKKIVSSTAHLLENAYDPSHPCNVDTDVNLWISNGCEHPQKFLNRYVVEYLGGEAPSYHCRRIARKYHLCTIFIRDKEYRTSLLENSRAAACDSAAMSTLHGILPRSYRAAIINFISKETKINNGKPLRLDYVKRNSLSSNEADDKHDDMVKNISEPDHFSVSNSDANLEQLTVFHAGWLPIRQAWNPEAKVTVRSKEESKYLRVQPLDNNDGKQNDEIYNSRHDVNYSSNVFETSSDVDREQLSLSHQSWLAMCKVWNSETESLAFYQ